MTFDPSYADDQPVIPGASTPSPPLGIVTLNPDFSFNQVLNPGANAGPLGMVTFNPDFCYGQPIDTAQFEIAAESNFDVTAFRMSFPLFASPVQYPDSMLYGWYGFATSYIDENPQYGIGALTTATQSLALQLMTAHLLVINQRIGTYGINSGRAAGLVKSTTVKDVSYTLEVPKATSAFGMWLNQTPFGQQLYALLTSKGVGGFYIGGTPGRAGFRPGAQYGFRRF